MDKERVWEPPQGPKAGVYIISLIFLKMYSREQILNLLFSSLYSFHFQDRESSIPYEFQLYTIFWLILISSCSPYIAMSSIDDYKVIMKPSLFFTDRS